MSIYFRQIQHLLPRTKTWSLPFGSTIRKFFEGIADGLSEPARDFIDGVWAEMFPETTNELVEWEQELGCFGSGTEAQRRLALAAEWQATGGQSPRYLQDTLQAAGFDVYYHGWWDPVAEEVRDPHDYTETAHSGTEQCHGTVDAVQDQCADIDTDDPPRCDFFLANTVYYIVNESLNRMAPPPLPEDEERYRCFIYFCGETFGDPVLIPEERLIELRRLMLKISPANMWIMSLVTSSDFSGFGTIAVRYALQDPYEVTYQDGTGEQADDWDLEEEDTSSWTVGNNAILSKQTADPYEGLRWMQIEYNGTSYPYALQTGKLVVGATYYANMWGHGDGTNAPRYMLGGIIWNGSTGTSWNNQKNVVVPTATYVRFQIQCTSGPAAIGVDSLSIQECPGITKAQNLNNPGTDDLIAAAVGVAGVHSPSWSEVGGLYAGQTNGSNQYWKADGVASVFAGTTGIEWSVGLTVDIDGVSGDQTLFCAGQAAGSNGYVRVWLNDDALKLTRVDDVGAELTVTLVTTITTGRHAIVVALGSSEADCWLDGVLVTDSVAFVYNTVTPDLFSVAVRRRSVLSDYFAGKYRDMVVYSNRVTDGSGLCEVLALRSPTS